MVLDQSDTYGCTGLTARWCPIHGACACPQGTGDQAGPGDDPACPLHAPDSPHAAAETAIGEAQKALDQLRAALGRIEYRLPHLEQPGTAALMAAAHLEALGRLIGLFRSTLTGPRRDGR